MKKRLFAFLISLVMVMICAAPVYAADSVVSETEEPFCIYSQTYEEITDVDTLLEMAIEEYTSPSPAAMPFSAGETKTPILQVGQLLSEQHYSDGHVEQSHAYTGFVLHDETGQILSADEVVDYFENEYLEYGNALGVYGYQTVYTKESFTYTDDPIIEGEVRGYISKIDSYASFNSSETCVEIFQRYDVVFEGFSEYYRNKTTNNPVSNRSYVLTTGDRTYHQLEPGLPYCDVLATTTFTTSSGEDFPAYFQMSSILYQYHD